MATSARRTSFAGRRGRFSSTPNAPGYGDPAFDPPFCLNHLLLKCLWAPAFGHLSSPCSTPTRRQRSPWVPWELAAGDRGSGGAASAGVAPGPRDGKSPVEYLTDDLANSARAPARGTLLHRGPAGAADRHQARMDRGASAVTDTCIARLHGRRVWDSRGRPTVEAEVTSRAARRGRAIAPAGRLDRHATEALDLRDGGGFAGGFGVGRALSGVMTKSRRRCGCRCRRSGGHRRPPDRSSTARRTRPARRQRAWSRPRSRRCRRVPPPPASPLWAASRGPATGAACRCRRSRSSAAARMPPRRVDVQDFMVVCLSRRLLRGRAAIGPPRSPVRLASLMRRAGKLQGVADEGGDWPAFGFERGSARHAGRAPSRRAGFTPGRRGADLPRCRRLGIRLRRCATAWRSTAANSIRTA